MVGGMEEFGGEAGDVSLHFAGGGSAVCVWGCGAGKIPDVYADAGKFQWVPSAFVLIQPGLDRASPLWGTSRSLLSKPPTSLQRFCVMSNHPSFA